MSNCSYTLQLTEQLLSLEQANKLTLKQENLLSNLVKQALVTTSDINNETNKNVKCLYGYLFDEENLDKEAKFSSLVSLADVDVFHYLVSLTLLSNQNKQDQFNLFKLMLQLQSLQIILNYLIATKFKNTDESVSLVKYLRERLNEKSFNHEESISNKKESIELNESSLKQSLMPFLRCSILFYWFLNDITQSVEVCQHITDNLNDFTQMITSLGLTESQFEDLVLNVNNPSLIFLINRF